jgi:hypothetical protein
MWADAGPAVAVSASSSTSTAETVSGTSASGTSLWAAERADGLVYVVGRLVVYAGEEVEVGVMSVAD